MSEKNLKKLHNLLQKYKINGFVIPSSDEFHNEYSPAHLKRLEWFTGFSGSNGMCILTDNKIGFFTDGRYLIQAKLEVPNNFEIYSMSLDDFESFFASIANYKLGFDPNIFTKIEYDFYVNLAKKFDIELVAIEENLIDEIWDDKPKVNKSKIIELPLHYTGKSTEGKVRAILAKFDQVADYFLLTNLDSIAWLLNIRANDIEYNPLLLSYLIMDNKGGIELFVEESNIDWKFPNIKISSLNQLKPKYLDLINSNKKIALDPTSASYWFVSQTPNNQLVNLEDPCLIPKACKNKVELKGFREVHIKDGVALCKFLYWMEQNIDNEIDEITAANKLLEYRRAQEGFQYPSFASISAFGANGAIIHYHPTPKTNKIINREGLYLIDSGGQYLNATTDVTRVTCYGKPTEEQKRNFTYVLKGMITLSNAKFPASTTGLQLDILARYYLWQSGLNYLHGTGHGVGHFLAVHEGPNRIATSKASYTALKEGMVTSIEPGFYQQDEYGIRIENLAIIKHSEHMGFLEFETITLAPIEIGLVDISMLNKDEILWLNAYHKKVYDTLSLHLEGDALEWLKNKTLPIVS